MRTAPDAVLFDIDGVLVDIRRSYIDAIRKTVQLYLEAIVGVRPSRRALLSRPDVHDFKLLGGFNNDWDAVFGLLVYFQSLIARRGKTPGEVSSSALASWKNFRALARTLPLPCGVREIKRLALSASLPSYELAKDMFQEIYLGGKLFRRLYRRAPLFSRGRGLIHEEKLLMPASVLAGLRERGLRLGIVTGRTAFEAGYVLRRFGIERLFDAVVTHDDVERAEKRTGRILRKPDPFPVLLAARKIRRAKRFLYVGDLPDDVRAANRAKKGIRIKSAGFVYRADSPRAMLREIKRARPDYILKSPAELARLVAAMP